MKKTKCFIIFVMFLILFTPAKKVWAQELSVNYGYKTYHVISGDTLSKIASNYNVSVTSIMRMNNLSSTIINIGQTLKIPDTSNDSMIYYTVQPKDTLWGISQRLGVSTYRIMRDNNLASSMLNIGQLLLIRYTNPVTTVNYRTEAGDTVWAIAQKYNTTVDAIMKSNYMYVDYFMVAQIVTVPLNSGKIVKPVGIKLMTPKKSIYYGDIYTWENIRRLFTVGTIGVAKDVSSGVTWNIRYYGGSNHADLVTLTKSDTDIMFNAFGSQWSWSNKRPVIITFTQGGVVYQVAASLTGMPHSTTDILTNGMAGHVDNYYYNSTGHSNPVVDPVAQANVIKANGQ